MRTLQAARWTRRAFLSGLTLAGTAGFLVILFVPLAADPPPPIAVARLAILAPGAPPTEAQLQRSVFQQTLRELGWHEGQNLVVARRYAEGKLDRLPDLAAELVQGQPHVILTWSTPGVLAAKQATTTIPIVVRGAGALLEQGLVASLARPGGNLTGVENTPPGLDGKRLALLKEVGPQIARVAFLFNPANPLWNFQLPRLETEARALGLELQRVEARDPSEFDTAFAWRRRVLPQDQAVDRRAYTLCVVERLQDSLRRRDVFVPQSERWGDPRAKLLRGAAWEAVRPQVCRTLGRHPTPTEELHALAAQLDEAYQRTAANLPTNTAVRLDPSGSRTTLTLRHLDKLEDPPSLIALRERVEALLPHVDLPEVLLEIHARTGFTQEFTHLSESGARVTDLPVSLCAVLLAEACNIGLEPVERPDVPALTRSRLSWIQQNYLRAETLTRANARLVDAQSQIPLAQMWGGGEVASADGLRFVVPIRTINAGPNPKYFGVGRGVTYYNFTSDQFTGFHSIVIPGTLRDSPYILEGLLEQETSLQPLELMADTAGVSDLVFGLFWLLGYQFSPRLADVGEARFWRMDLQADYGALNALARQRINVPLIARNWDDMLRVAGSLLLGTVRASELLRSFLRSGRPSTLARALGELGRIPKTLYLLSYIDDETYRRRILLQLNRGEGRHRLALATFHGQRGELRQRYREGQEDQLSALGLVVNVIVLWNTLYMEAALNYVRAEGVDMRPEDVARLSPLGYKHINFLGQYSFDLAETVAQGALRPLRTSADLQEEFP
jgi:TnpA family transposase